MEFKIWLRSSPQEASNDWVDLPDDSFVNFEDWASRKYKCCEGQEARNDWADLTDDFFGKFEDGHPVNRSSMKDKKPETIELMIRSMSGTTVSWFSSFTISKDLYPFGFKKKPKYWKPSSKRETFTPNEQAISTVHSASGSLEINKGFFWFMKSLEVDSKSARILWNTCQSEGSDLSSIQIKCERVNSFAYR